MSEFILEVNQLTKTIKTERVLKEVSMHVRRNTVYGLLGPNGAGKSTTLKIIAGLMAKTSGDVLLAGKPWQRQDLERIGSLIESPGVYGNLTALENVAVITTALGIEKGRGPEVLEIVGLSQVDPKKLVKSFSMGMKQRLGIAIALINRPELLILDEPTNGLDPLAVQELRTLILSFANHNITTVISSHILSELAVVVDDIGIMMAGETRYEGALDPSQNLEELFLTIVKQTN